MSLTELLNEKYPVRPSLVFPVVRKRVRFLYENGVDPAVRRRFEDGLHDLGLDIVSDHSVSDEETVTVTSAGGCPCLKRKNGQIFRFAEADPVNAMLWVSYCIAADNGWLPETKDSTIITRCYNIASQRLASNILYSIKRKFYDVPDVSGLIKDTVLEFSARFTEEVPLFVSQIVTGGGIELVQKQSGWFARRKEMKLEDLAETLYGSDKNFEDEITGYCAFLSSGSDKYRKAMNKAVENCIGRFYASPINRLKESVETAEREILLEYDSSDEIGNAKEKLRAARRIKHITPEVVRTTFTDINEDYRNAARKMVICHFLTEMTDELRERIDREFRQIRDRLKVFASEMSFYSVLNEADYGFEIRWTKGGEPEFGSFATGEAVWKASEIQDAQMNSRVPDGYRNLVWFAGEAVCAEAENNGSQYPVQLLGTLDRSLLCAIYSRDNTGTEKMI